MTTKTLESLISINNKLQQPDAASGVLTFAQKHHHGDFVSKIDDLYHTKAASIDDHYLTNNTFVGDLYHVCVLAESSGGVV